jgi:hypothetical protein
MKKQGIGNIEDMVCARLPEVVALRDQWIQKHTLRMLIEDYKTANRYSKDDKRN